MMLSLSANNGSQLKKTQNQKSCHEDIAVLTGRIYGQIDI